MSKFIGIIISPNAPDGDGHVPVQEYWGPFDTIDGSGPAESDAKTWSDANAPESRFLVMEMNSPGE
jgi:hypothetical protein